MPSLTDIPEIILYDTRPKPIIDWLAPIKIPHHCKRTLFRLWALDTGHSMTKEDFQLIKANSIDKR